MHQPLEGERIQPPGQADVEWWHGQPVDAGHRLDDLAEGNEHLDLGHEVAVVHVAHHRQQCVAEPAQQAVGWPSVARDMARRILEQIAHAETEDEDERQRDEKYQSNVLVAGAFDALVFSTFVVKAGAAPLTERADASAATRAVCAAVLRERSTTAARERGRVHSRPVDRRGRGASQPPLQIEHHVAHVLAAPVPFRRLVAQPPPVRSKLHGCQRRTKRAVHGERRTFLALGVVGVRRELKVPERVGKMQAFPGLGAWLQRGDGSGQQRGPWDATHPSAQMSHDGELVEVKRPGLHGWQT